MIRLLVFLVLCAIIEKSYGEEAPMNKIIGEEDPMHKIIVEEAPMNKIIVEEAPMNKIIVEEAPMNKIIVEEAPMNKIIVEEAPMNKINGEEDPMNKIDDDENPMHIHYLTKFGYLLEAKKGGPPQSFSANDIDSAIKTAQKYAGLPMTGKLDNHTKKMMMAPRCGLADSGPMALRFGQSRWEKRNLTYGFINYSAKMRSDQTVNKFREAFATWAKPSGLHFSLVQDAEMADIKIGFFKGEHGDDSGFDGPGRVLAHAHFPGPDIGGDIHIDESENWSISDPSDHKFLILPTITHELGHSMGLEHSYARGSVMQAHYTLQTTLGKNDILAIQQLYGLSEE